ncbi:MAG TPA: hypothetical protein VJ608_12820 [Albitalea sp.]|nr:hypothetical protein [Albitalea sp.]
MKTLHSTGVNLTYYVGRGWVATVDFSSREFAKAPCIDGSIGTQYFAPDLAAVIDRALEAARSIGVVFDPTSALSMDKDGDGVPAPLNWRELVIEQSKRLGWECYYQPEPAPR